MIAIREYKADTGETPIRPRPPGHDEQSALQQHCTQWQFWSWEETHRSLQDRRYHLLVASMGETWIGSLLYWVGIEHGELLYIFTDPLYRQQGVGKALALYMEHQLRQIPTCQRLYLEVRASNQAAQRLYRNLGLQETQVRKKYYADGEDAVIFTKEICSL